MTLLETPLQPLKDALKAHLLALGGWHGIEDSHIILGINMVEQYILELETERERKKEKEGFSHTFS